ncbi:MAG: transglutaminase family protein, partial [Methylobacterium sp.]
MSIKAALHHVTHYTYDRPITLGPQVIRLRPAPHTRTAVPAYSLKVLPENHFINWQQDPNGNWLARLVFPEKTTELKIEVDLTADMSVINPFDFFVEDYAQTRGFTYADDLTAELKPYLVLDDAMAPEVDDFLTRLPAEPNTVLFLVALNAQVAGEITYGVRMEPGVQTAAETLTLKSGSCRDSAWLMVQILRRLGMAARFVSGYLIQLVPDTTAVDGPVGTATDFTDLHAWAEVYLPGAGWIGLDATSGLLCGEGHIPLAATPHYNSAAPISGLAAE